MNQPSERSPGNPTTARALIVWPVALLTSIVAGAVPVSADVGPSTAERPRAEHLWRHYMHGITDALAASIDTGALFDLPRTGPPSLEPVRIPAPSGDFPATAVVLGARQRVLADRPLPVDRDVVGGRRIRLFVWVRGLDTGRRTSANSYGDHPVVALVVRDAEGRQLARSSPMDGPTTTGTFPWHCYHVELFVPRDGAAVLVELGNPAGGRAWFAGFSWEIAEGDRSVPLDARQDPLTGSVASNVHYDDLNRQFFRGTPGRHRWSFLRGPRAGVIGIRHDITTPEGLRAWFDDQVRTDADHVNHGLMYLASRYHIGRTRGLLPPGMDDDWLAALRELVLGLQDPATGYWGTRSRPVSMAMTFHLVEGLFAWHGPRRADRPEAINPTRHLGITGIPLAERIARTTLAMQATVSAGDGRRPAGWPRSAYDFTRTPDAGRERASLVTTGNAIELLRRVERFVAPDLQREIYRAIRAAVRYVLECCVDADGVWRQSDTAREPTSAGYMERILGMSHYLERKVDDSIEAPQVAAEREGDGALVIRWRDPAATHDLLRIYAVADGRHADRLDHADLVGIVHRTGSHFIGRDPLLVAQAMGRAAAARWGRGWNRDSYVGGKVDALPADLVVVDRLAPIRVGVPRGHRLYAAAATWYGEESSPIAISAAERP